MADNITLNPGTGGDTLAAKDASSVKHQRVLVEASVAGTPTDVSAAAPLPVVARRRGSADLLLDYHAMATSEQNPITATLHVEDGLVINPTSSQVHFTLKNGSDQAFFTTTPIPPFSAFPLPPMTLTGGLKITASSASMRLHLRYTQ
jgi:hypothetical protein